MDMIRWHSALWSPFFQLPPNLLDFAIDIRPWLFYLLCFETVWYLHLHLLCDDVIHWHWTHVGSGAGPASFLGVLSLSEFLTDPSLTELIIHSAYKGWKSIKFETFNQNAVIWYHLTLIGCKFIYKPNLIMNLSSSIEIFRFSLANHEIDQFHSIVDDNHRIECQWTSWLGFHHPCDHRWMMGVSPSKR